MSRRGGHVREEPPCSCRWSGQFLAGAGIWGALRQLRQALVVGASVFSHWILDFITHRPDMPLSPGSHVYAGLGLWNSKIGTALVESAFYAAGVAIYLRATRRADRTGAWAFASMAALLALIYAANFNGPPPPSVNAIIVVSFVLWLFIPWAFWADPTGCRSATGADSSRAADRPVEMRFTG